MHSKKGLRAIASPDARLLILGSLPGDRSLAAGEYYANPQNAFWRIMQQLVGLDPRDPYEARVRVLQQNGIALWDVCNVASRPGSADSAISKRSVVANDFATFLTVYPAVRRIGLNGTTAAKLFRRLVHPDILDRWPQLQSVLLPSSSSAYATMPFHAKVAIWKGALTGGEA